jgi:DNA replication protein DnaC
MSDFYKNYKLTKFDLKRGAVKKDNKIVCRFCNMPFIRPIENKYYMKAIKEVNKATDGAKLDQKKSRLGKIFSWYFLASVMSAFEILPTCAGPCAYNKQQEKNKFSEIEKQSEFEKRELLKRLEKSFIGKKYIDMPYQEDLLPKSNFNQALYLYNKDLETNIKTQMLLFISGLPGRGKTTATNFILINAARIGYRVAYITGNDLAFLHIKDAERNKYILTCKLVVIDDIGLSDKQGSTTNIIDTIKELINRGASIMLIRNVDKKAIKEILELATDAQGKNGIVGTVIDGFDDTITVEGYNLRELYKNNILDLSK